MMQGAGGASRPAGLASASSRSQKVPLGGVNTMGGEKGKKKMVIRPFKVQPKVPENFEDITWEKLKVNNQSY